jgi:hypothetical protein
MAWRYQPIKIYVNLQDGKGSIASAYIRVPIDADFASAQAFAASYANACADASLAEITGVQIVADAKRALPSAPTGTSDVFRQGVILFGTTVAEDRYLFEIPSLRTDLLLTTGEYAGVKIDQTRPEIQTILNLLLNGDGTVTPTGLTGYDLDHIREAYVRRL